VSALGEPDFLEKRVRDSAGAGSRVPEQARVVPDELGAGLAFRIAGALGKDADALPDLGGRIVVSTRITVVLPAPFGPRKPSTIPVGTSRSSASTARSVPYVFERPCASSATGELMSPPGQSTTR
jgi:hypothetical protein